MTTMRQSDIAYAAAVKIISPKEVRFMVSLLCVLVACVFVLWSSSNTRWQHVIIQGQKIAKQDEKIAALEKRLDLVGQMEQQNTVLRAIAKELGVVVEGDEE